MTQEKTIKFSEVVERCRAVLCTVTVQGVQNCRALTAVYDDLGVVVQYLTTKEQEAKNDSDKND